MNMGLIDHPLSPLIVAWMEAVNRRAAYATSKNIMEEIFARDVLNAALEPRHDTIAKAIMSVAGE